jgi:hypothetical protein
VAEINWTLIQELATKPHKHLRPIEDGAQTLTVGAPNYIGEVLQETRAAQHLLDLAGIPEGVGYAVNVDARVYLAITELNELRERLARVADWHSRMTGPGGTFDDYCRECGDPHPCDTRRMAEGTYESTPDGAS